MPTDRSLRPLTSLEGASTSRVLNLLAIAQRWRDDPDYRVCPLFLSPVINSAIILKHRLRGDESYLFDEPRIVATKIIVPFDPRDLSVGGRSWFVGQRGFADALAKLGHNGGGTDRDRMVLSLIDKVPSLDPFLLREHLKTHEIEVANCYFEISPADQTRMHEYAAEHLTQLISLASGGDSEGNGSATRRLVSALLSNEVDEKLEPLQRTLQLKDDEFREGVFSWRGFLFYKWSMSNVWPQVRDVLKDLKAVTPLGHCTPDDLKYVREAKVRIIDALRRAGLDLTRSIRVYDEAYEQLVRSGRPKLFRDFLLGAPHMFLDLGENMAALSHVTSFWRYRFPDGAQACTDPNELCAIFQDFESGFPLADPEATEAA